MVSKDNLDELDGSIGHLLPALLRNHRRSHGSRFDFSFIL
jgi:hypothetical protein